MPERKRRTPAGGTPTDVADQNPMDEENFPDRSPTRDAVEREMDEPSNLRGPAHPKPRREPPTYEGE